MIMMQTGMVKHGHNSTSLAYIDGMNSKRYPNTAIVGFICKKTELNWMSLFPHNVLYVITSSALLNTAFESNPYVEYCIYIVSIFILFSLFFLFFATILTNPNRTELKIIETT